MPWKAMDTMSLREELIQRAQQEGANVSALCRAYHINHKTGYKWLRRYAAQGLAGLADATRRPRASPRRLSPAQEARIVAERQAHPTPCAGRALLQRSFRSRADFGRISAGT